MRLIAMVLFAAALAKVGLVKHLHHAGARDVIIAAYGAEAIAACEKSDPKLKLAPTTAEIDVQIGDRARSVSLWQVDNPEWVDRYRKVYMIVKAAGGEATCRFDVLQRTVAAGLPAS
jgi:hypothetical protein